MRLVFKKETVEIDFSHNITIFYGKIAVGKTSIANLIDFCLGGDLIETPAIKSEFVSSTLNLLINNKNVEISRGRQDNSVLMNWSEESGQKMVITVPIRENKKTPVIEPDIYNFSDVMHFLMGHLPPKVKRSKSDEESPLIRLSFRQILWYCYLDQDGMESNFFNLYTPILQAQSRDVIRYLIGYYSDELIEVENRLAGIRQEVKTQNLTIQKLQSFLEPLGYNSIEKLKGDIEELKKKQLELNDKKKDIEEGYLKDTDSFKDLKTNLNKLRNEKISLQDAMNDVINRIKELDSLKSEYEMSLVKLARMDSANKALSKLDFVKCPVCYQAITQGKQDSGVCYLCRKPLDLEAGIAKNTDAMKEDLELRILEIKEATSLHKNRQNRLEKDIIAISGNLDVVEREYYEKTKKIESRYMDELIAVERGIATTNEKILNINRLTRLPEEIQTMEVNVKTSKIEEHELEIKIKTLKDKIPHPTLFITTINTNFKQILLDLKVPWVSAKDTIEFNLIRFTPSIKAENGEIEYSFLESGSGGKKTLLRIGWALALHKTAVELNLPLPPFLMFDSFTKNIGEYDKGIISAVFSTIYKMSNDCLKNTQFIIMDKEYIEPKNTVDISTKLMDEKNKLIPYYNEV